MLSASESGEYHEYRRQAREHPMVGWLMRQVDQIDADDQVATPAPWQREISNGASYILPARSIGGHRIAQYVARLAGASRAARTAANVRLIVTGRNIAPNLVHVARALLDEHLPARAYVYRDDGRRACSTCGDGTVEWPCPTLHLLAFTFAGWCPGWQPEWAPVGLPPAITAGRT